MRDVEKVLTGYLACALWASSDEDGRPLNGMATIDDISEASKEFARKECAAFLAENAELLDASELDEDQIGHDLWLTRNGHGTGFWDRNLNEVGYKLTKKAEALGECWAYIGDNGEVDIA